MKYLKHWLPAILWACFIFYMSSIQGTQLPSIPLSDKIIHAIVYLVLGFFTARALVRAHNLSLWPVIFTASMLAGIYGMTDEIHQMFVPTRTAEMFDLLSDFAGGFMGAFIYGYFLS